MCAELGFELCDSVESQYSLVRINNDLAYHYRVQALASWHQKMGVRHWTPTVCAWN